MIIRHIGHASFYLETEGGFRIVTDPYDSTCGYPVLQTEADAVLVSHGHHDHNAVENVSGAPVVVSTAGSHHLGDDVHVTAVEADHDDAGGSKRGKNLMFVIEAEGLRVMHLGDLGHIPTDEQLAALGKADAVMIPVGGFYTIDAPAAVEVLRLLDARIALPMHYKTCANADWPIDGVERFNQLWGTPVEFVDLLRVTRGDMTCQPDAAVLKPVSLR